MTTIQAAVAVAKNAPLELKELRLDTTLRPGEILVRLQAVGVCHTDATILESPEFPLPFPAVLGHEGAGVVESVGQDVIHLSAGDKVVLSFGSCGTCRKCRQGHPAYCDDFYSHNLLGARLDGSATLFDASEAVSGSFFSQSSFASHVIGNLSNVVKVGNDVDLDIAGPLGCGLLTGASSVKNVLKPDSGDTFAVYGAGGVGFAALMMAKVMGCRTIIAVDIKESRLKLAAELGATHVINGKDPNLAEQIRAITAANQGVDCAIDTTGLSTVCKVAVETLRSGGRLSLNAPPRHDGPGLDVAGIPLGACVYGTVMGDAVPGEMVPCLIELHKQGLFPFDRLIKFYDLVDINQAFVDIADGSTIKPVIRFPK